MEEEKFFTSGQVSKMLSVTPMTLRNWDKHGILKPHHVAPSGYRYYSEQQIRVILDKAKEERINQNSLELVTKKFNSAIKNPKNVFTYSQIESADVNKKSYNESSKQPLFKIYVDVGKNELWLNYYVMRSGKTNSLALATSDKLFKKLTENVGGQEMILDEGKSIFTEPMHGVTITVDNEDLDKLNSSITKAILWIQLCFTNRLGFDHPPDDVIEEARYMKWYVDDYMEFCGLKDRDKAIEKMRRDLYLLSKAEIQWEEEIVSRDSQGKPIYKGGYRDKNNRFVPKLKKEKHTFRGTFISTRDLHPVNGVFSYWINKEFATYLAHAGVVAVHKEIFGLNLQKYPHSATLATKLNEYFSMNKGKLQANKLSVSSLLNAMPRIPKYNSLKIEETVVDENGNEKKSDRNGGNGGWKRRIYIPFKKAMDSLVEKDILSEWHFSDCDIPKSYLEFMEQYVYFTPSIVTDTIPDLNLKLEKN